MGYVSPLSRTAQVGLKALQLRLGRFLFLEGSLAYAPRIFETS